MEGKEQPLKKEGGKKKKLTKELFYLGIIRDRVYLLLLECRMGNEGTGSIAFGSLTPLIPGRCHTLLPKEAGARGPCAVPRWGWQVTGGGL